MSPDNLDRDRSLIRLTDHSVSELKGIGKKILTALGDLGINNVYDLVTHYPRTYRDSSRSTRIANLQEGVETTVFALVTKVDLVRLSGRRTMVNVELSDETGSIRCSFFNQPWRARQLQVDCEVYVAGKPTKYKNWLSLSNPVVDIIGRPGSRRTGRVVAIYPQSEKAGITTWDFEGWISEALRRTGKVSDPVPGEFLADYHLVDRTYALHNIHSPANMKAVYLAKTRLIFDEMLRLQLCLLERKAELEKSNTGITHLSRVASRAPSPDNRARVGEIPVVCDLVGRLVETLDFSMTGAQVRAIDEIAQDMARPYPMHRLVQGDVGSGKTLVALCAMLIAAQGGHQGAILVPTEILAEQHYRATRNLVKEFSMPDSNTLTGERPFRVELLTSSTPQASRKKILSDLAGGYVDALVGTHSLLSDEVRFQSLGIVVVDEQHRFGVNQRDTLRTRRSDGKIPDLLVMTATPIPRTVAMTVFGDLDVSVIDEMPPGRVPIETAWLALEEEPAWERVRDEVSKGNQAYVVCPLVGPSGAIEARAAQEEYHRLTNGPLGGLSIGLVHGQMGARDKEASMEAFRSGEVSVLVSTTVIEVGVDVPAATVIVIEDAWRFGIAQLHQLRGRVGRGGGQSWCYLLGDPAQKPGQSAKRTQDVRGKDRISIEDLGLEFLQDDLSKAGARLMALCKSNDGFLLAEEDLKIRGEGTITGSSQAGKGSLKLGSVIRDKHLVQLARECAREMIEQGYKVQDDPELSAEISYLIGDSRAGYLLKG